MCVFAVWRKKKKKREEEEEEEENSKPVRDSLKRAFPPWRLRRPASALGEGGGRRSQCI